MAGAARPHRCQVSAQLVELRAGHAGGRHPRRRGLKQPSHLEDVEDGVVARRLSGDPDSFKQAGWLQGGHERAEAAPDLDEPHVAERPNRLAHRAAGNAEPTRQLGLGREP
jgi:hypothetical protein